MTTLDVALAAASTLVAAAFALSTFDRWLRRRRPQDQAWAVSLALFALGSAALWWAFARGWSAPSFRLFYLCGAILNVPWLALGSVFLVSPRWGQRIRPVLSWSSGVATGVMLATPLRAAVPADELPKGKELFGVWPRVLAAVGSGVAAMVIIGIAIGTTVAMVRHRTPALRSAPEIAAGGGATGGAVRHRVVGNVLIAVGTLVLSASGTLAGRLGESRAFVVTLLAGIVVLFAGFLVANGRSARPWLSTFNAAAA